MPLLYQKCYTLYMNSVADLVEEDSIKELATPSDFRAGQEIADNGGVEFTELTPLKVSAFVNSPSSQLRTAILESAPSGLTWHCTCSSNRAVFCKHLVATAVETGKKASRHH